MFPAWWGPYPPGTPSWTGRTPYTVEPGGDSDRFAITDGNQLSMVSAAADQTLCTATIAADNGNLFGDDSNRQTTEVVLRDGVP